MHLALDDHEYDTQQSLLSLSPSATSELPFLPGIHKYGDSSPVSRKNWSRTSWRNSRPSLPSPGLSVSIEDLEAFQSVLSPFPHEATSFGQLSGRYSIRSEERLLVKECVSKCSSRW